MLKDTIISAFNYDGTLLKWLKKVEDALQNASASEFRVNKKGNATISFSIVFANGDTLESGDIILQQGESVTGATIRQGHLILTLSNGDELDAGDLGAVTGFSINASQHLIVTYQNGSTQDLGAIFSGNVNINGALSTPILTSQNDYIEAQKPVVEVMTGYNITLPQIENITKEGIYAGVVKNGNKLTIAVALNITRTGDVAAGIQKLINIAIPTSVGSKLRPTLVGDSNVLSVIEVGCFSQIYASPILLQAAMWKLSNNLLEVNVFGLSRLTQGTKYYLRYEITFLLSDNLAQ